MSMVRGDEIRAAYTPPVSGIEERILGLLSRRGACTSWQVSSGVSGAGPGVVVSALARLVDEGKIIGERTPTTARGGRPGVIYRLAGL